MGDHGAHAGVKLAAPAKDAVITAGTSRVAAAADILDAVARPRRCRGNGGQAAAEVAAANKTRVLGERVVKDRQGRHRGCVCTGRVRVREWRVAW